MCINQQVVVRAGETIKKDQVLIEGMSIKDGELALGKDVLVAFMNHGGYNFEDSIILSRRLVQDDEFTSIHIIESNIDIRDTKLGPEQITRDVPNVGEDMLRNLDADGIVAIGSEVGPGDILVGKITPKGETELTGEARLLRAIFGDNAKEVRDTSLRVKNDEGGKVVGVKIFSRENGHDLRSGTLMHVQILIARMQKAEVGDKFAGRHGNKGCIAKIMAIEDMPFTEDGRPVDVILNPLGIGARMNMGQVFEVHLGLAAEALGYKAQTPVFDRIKSEQIAEELQKAGFNRDGKVQLIDGRTGELFKDRVAIGIMHMIKLEHMASNKVHARSTGPYAMITQQPLGGKAQNGGQRFGEMEVWALEAHGAANTLQEMLTIKSDDVLGRGKAYESLVKQQPIVGARYPESFKVLSNELRGLGLEIELVEKEGDEYEVDDDMNSKDVMRPDDLDQNAIDKELAAMNSEVSDEHAPKEVVDTDLEKEITEEGEDA
jgi:DNA-directed RNA polymerase subunit beta